MFAPGIEWLNRNKRLVIGGFFGVLLLVGFLAHNDYGVSTDEPAMRKFGNDTFEYLFKDGPVPSAIDWTFHGPAYQLILATAQRLTGVTDGADIWFQRHLLSFFLFFAGAAFFYLLAKKYLDDWKMALLGTGFLVLSPRVFAHGFYNPKDMPAMVLFIIAVYTLLLVLERRSILRMLGHAIACGLLISLRTFGMLVPLLGLSYLLFDALRNGRGTKTFGTATGYGLLVLLCTVATWPVLWTSPLENFLAAIFDNTSRAGGGLYIGHILDYTPWHYVPVWMAITTPMLYSLLFLAGLGLLVIFLARHPKQFLKERPRVIVLCWFFAPLLALIFLRIGIFNEWRHMLFLYPAFLLIALDGLGWMFSLAERSKILQMMVTACVVLSLGSTTFWMIKNHPFQYAYFSIPSKLVDGNFELDYWNLSYRQALEHILEIDKRDRITVYPVSRTGVAAADTLPLEEWERLYFVQPGEADYIIDNFVQNGYERTLPDTDAIHSIVIDGLTIATVYRGPIAANIFGEVSSP